MCVCVFVFRCICFSPDGDCLYSGATDCLRVFGWEPDRCFDVVTAGWGKVSDLAICNQQLVSSSAHRLLPSVLKASSSEAACLFSIRSACPSSSPLCRLMWWI